MLIRPEEPPEYGIVETIHEAAFGGKADYVFDGARRDGAPYTALDAPRPQNRYGQSKLAGELAVRAACARSVVVRSSWVFGAGKAGLRQRNASSVVDEAGTDRGRG